ncbi:inner centromere protein A-like isoform X2 [Stegodyphus dumicola]|nr:inner centromere protein A-like isoform X2 [Stegodyphus dumicola]XP_035231237.1 inner centromere protein A-like isoform X2 [Stegodyphus dumicola]
MSVETSVLNKTPPRESYWFAHGGIEEISPGNLQSGSNSAGDAKEIQLQKDKEERIRHFREQQEEERLRKLKDLEQQFLLAKKHREQQEEERKRKIEEARIREMERRQQVEERKRQIWEAEQERKEAILRRNMEREARIEARRNAQRNSQCFAFGSSTPRTFDLDLAAIGVGRNVNQGTVLMSSVSGRRSEERDLGPPRATSACSLDRKFENDISVDDFSKDYREFFRSSSLEPFAGRVSNLSKQIAMQHKSSDNMKACLSMWDGDVNNQPDFFDSVTSGWLVGSGVLIGDDCMSRSMVSLSSSAFRGRKRTDIMPTLTRERSITPHITPRGNQSMRAVSMTRLDQLAQPRRTYRDLRNHATGTTTMNGGPRTVSPSMSKSMCNLANSAAASRGARAPVAQQHGSGNMSQSMMHLADISSQKDNRRLTPSPTFPKSSMRSAQSMMHLAAAPRLTRAARLRAQALAGNRAASAWNLNKPDSYAPGHYLSPGKDASRSPSRPQSSMSGASEISATSSSVSTVNMRPRVAPRRPRPYSIAGSTADRTSMTSTSIKKEVERPPTATRKDPERPSRSIDKNVLNTVQKPQRAKSASKEKDEAQNTRPSMPKKPVPPPKSLEVLARAKSHPVPIKDNLRKNVKPNAGVNNPALGATKPHTDMKGKSPEIEHIKPSIMKSESETKSLAPEMKKNSPVTSPTTDSEICISSDDSKVSAVTESEVNTMTQSATDSEWRLETSEISSLSKSSSIPVADQNNLASEVDKSDSIPNIPKEPIKAEKESNIVTTENLETHVATEVSEKYATTGESEKCLSTKEPSKHEHMKQTKVSEKRVSTEESERRENVENENVNTKEFIPSKPRITSEEEAKAALAEKRRLAREQAEREAELERQRLEEIRRKEEEQRRLEELEQKRMEEEQIRLAELHRQLEEEKLRKAIEEQKQREREEQERKEEEARQKAEKEEQERKAREEAERQRIELEERLKKEEEERAERKRRVEQIMARTRAKAAASSSNSQNENIVKSTKAAEMSSSATSIEASKQNILPQANNIVNISNGGFETKVENSSVSFSATTNHVSNSSSWPFSDENRISHKEALPDLLNTENISNHSNKSNGFCVGRSEQLVSNSSVSNSFKITSNRTLSANEVTSPSQTNGYSSHEEMSCTTSPEEMSNAGLLISIETSQSKSNKVSQDSTDFTKLVDIEPSSLDNNVNNENYLINVDDVNSNLLNSENPFMTFEDSLSKKQESPFTDLLS